jgi:hypothetical protein
LSNDRHETLYWGVLNILFVFENANNGVSFCPFSVELEGQSCAP